MTAPVRIQRPSPARLALTLLLALGAPLAPLVAAPPTPEASSPASGERADGDVEPVDLNRASLERLQSVPGIGPATAARIVAFREEHGPFRRVDDLIKVRGIGEKSLERIRPHVRVGEAAG